MCPNSNMEGFPWEIEGFKGVTVALNADTNAIADAMGYCVLSELFLYICSRYHFYPKYWDTL